MQKSKSIFSQYEFGSVVLANYITTFALLNVTTMKLFCINNLNWLKNVDFKHF